MKPPTTYRGYMDDTAWSYAMAEALEYVPDLMWPSSIRTYASMRHDPQLAAVIKAYSLLVRHGTWTIDPAGCRDEVVRLVADDLGIPVAGDDKPGAARVRGVSWRDHLRSALSCLVFGHAGFEMLAEVKPGPVGDKTARLVALAERMQHTISMIHVDTNGTFLGITQDAPPKGSVHTPQIDARRMVWYANEREGSSWQGQSLLRPAYGPWLFKREMITVLATSSRRFGMGVPTVQWDAGVTPTAAQMSEARMAASAARVGDQSGMTLPPGASLVLAGLSGGTPDTLAFVRWLDQQISGMALARFMDLGDTPNGSRALGESFVDFFMMAVTTVADDLADTATRQIAARIVDWNWGPEEPIPTIRCGDIGSRHEITAEALNSLLSSGALTAGPEIEAYVRREYGLPPKPLRRPSAILGRQQPPSDATADSPAPADEEDTPTSPPVGEAELQASAELQDDLDWGLFGG
jgi:hypothetical protein